MTSAVAPTGERVDLTFNLTSAGAAIEVRRAGRLARVVRLGAGSALNLDAAGRRLTSVSVAADRSLKGATSWGRTDDLTTTPHPVVAASDAVAGDSLPMVGGRRVHVGSNLVSEAEWAFSLSRNGAGGSGQMLGIRKRLEVNGETLMTVHFDKLQRREVLLRSGQRELLEVRYDSGSRPIHWQPREGGFEPMTQGYDRFGRLQRWRRGGVAEDYEYDQGGRLKRVSRGNETLLEYHFESAAAAAAAAPVGVSTGGGGKYALEYSGGGLRRVQTPRGHFHSFLLRPAVGTLRFQYSAPWSGSGSYELVFDASGNVRYVMNRL